MFVTRGPIVLYSAWPLAVVSLSDPCPESPVGGRWHVTWHDDQWSSLNRSVSRQPWSHCLALKWVKQLSTIQLVNWIWLDWPLSRNRQSKPNQIYTFYFLWEDIYPQSRNKLTNYFSQSKTIRNIKDFLLLGLNHDYLKDRILANNPQFHCHE